MFQIRAMTPPRSQSTGAQSVPEADARKVEPGGTMSTRLGMPPYMFSNVRMASITVRPTYGFGMKSAFAGISLGLALPVVMMM
jgi:hypothetical protein